MPYYEVEHEGRKYRIVGPAAATQEQAEAEIRRCFPAPAGTPAAANGATGTFLAGLKQVSVG